LEEKYRAAEASSSGSKPLFTEAWATALKAQEPHIKNCVTEPADMVAIQIFDRFGRSVYKRGSGKNENVWRHWWKVASESCGPQSWGIKFMFVICQWNNDRHVQFDETWPYLSIPPWAIVDLFQLCLNSEKLGIASPVPFMPWNSSEELPATGFDLSSESAQAFKPAPVIVDSLDGDGAAFMNHVVEEAASQSKTFDPVMDRMLADLGPLSELGQSPVWLALDELSPSGESVAATSSGSPPVVTSMGARLDSPSPVQPSLGSVAGSSKKRSAAPDRVKDVHSRNRSHNKKARAPTSRRGNQYMNSAQFVLQHNLSEVPNHFNVVERRLIRYLKKEAFGADQVHKFWPYFQQASQVLQESGLVRYVQPKSRDQIVKFMLEMSAFDSAVKAGVLGKLRYTDKAKLGGAALRKGRESTQFEEVKEDADLSILPSASDTVASQLPPPVPPSSKRRDFTDREKQLMVWLMQSNASNGQVRTKELEKAWASEVTHQLMDVAEGDRSSMVFARTPKSIKGWATGQGQRARVSGSSFPYSCFCLYSRLLGFLRVLCRHTHARTHVHTHLHIHTRTCIYRTGRGEEEKEEREREREKRVR
jgi:hypothetical protein